METIVTEVTPMVAQCNCYCEGMITEDSKDKKKTKDIIAD